MRRRKTETLLTQLVETQGNEAKLAALYSRSTAENRQKAVRIYELNIYKDEHPGLLPVEFREPDTIATGITDKKHAENVNAKYMADQIGFIVPSKKADIDTSRYTEGTDDGVHQSIPHYNSGATCSFPIGEVQKQALRFFY